MSVLNTPHKLPCGLTFPNRLVKGPMAEGLADSKTWNPSDKMAVAYDHWGSGGWGGIFTGNVEVSTAYKGANVLVTPTKKSPESSKNTWKQWAASAQKHGTPTIVQLVHPGRQMPPGAGDRPAFSKSLAPSPIPLVVGNGLLNRVFSKLVFGTPREMTQEDIDTVVEEFAFAAKTAHEAGFKGVELHGAHGYLITQFLSPRTNLRTDAYGGSAANRTKILIDIIRAIKAVVPATFAIGIKFNSADDRRPDSLEESLEQLKLVLQEKIDFLDITGGDLEDPKMNQGPDPASQRTAQREAFFLDYARAVRTRFPNITLMVTGGFRTRKGMQAAIESGACDLIGISRPAVVYPHLPKDIILNEKVPDEDAVVRLATVEAKGFLKKMPIAIIHIGAESMYYSSQIQNRIAHGKEGIAPE